MDVLVIGAGPAGLALAAALASHGLRVQGLTPTPPTTHWINTYGIWRDELEPLSLTHLLGHAWSDCVVYAAGRELALPRVYGLLDNDRLQAHLLAQAERGGVVWHEGTAAAVEHGPTHSQVRTTAGAVYTARLVVDASGHRPALVQRPALAQPAFQAAYGVVGRFSAPPVGPGRLVLMDYRADHLTPAERQAGPPTFLYAMDLGDDLYFVEETSLAHAPAVPFDQLQGRLERRLRAQGVEMRQGQHVEHCLFPMNLPLPDLRQPVVGFGGAASMVHPASGYLVGAVLKRAPHLAQTVARALDGPARPPAETARMAWRALWPPAEVRKRRLYLFGLHTLLRLDEALLNAFFAAFFQLPPTDWAGYLSNTLTTPALLSTMLRLFRLSPPAVRRQLARSVTHAGGRVWRTAP